MDVSIITMTTTYNYGATLQAFALQHFIESLGHHVQILDHMSESEGHKNIKLADFSRNNIARLIYKNRLEEGYYRFEDFYKNYMHMSKRYPDYQTLICNPPSSDVFISGSDQVLNPKDPKLERFLLEFVPDDRIKATYAASVGDGMIPETVSHIYKKGLSRFDFISVREEQGKKLISAYTKKEISIHCDPIFLIDNWNDYENKVKLPFRKYILCYMIYLPTWFNEWITKLKQKTRLPIVFVGLNGYRRVYNDKYIRNAGPMEFLWLIHNAEMVVSSSFHGNAFSVKYGKPFISLPDPKRPDRISYLLKKYSLEKNIIFQPDFSILNNKYDYENIRKIIKNEQMASKKYLQTVLGEVI